MANQPPPQTRQVGFSLPLPYRLFFLVLEPISALGGAYLAHFQQHDYLVLTHAASAPALASVPTGTSIALSQLANLYMLFALNEALVLRSTSDLRVWKTLLFVLLVADLGHLYTLRALGSSIYLPWNFAKWNAIDWGSIPFVYLGAAMRTAFLANVGIKGAGKKPSAAGKKK
ncbi:hypothetical protein BD289DRAFT_373295 [Coniella lustricola]|uniref:DUF7704 domain-containing protein n=1 Tax=Coniella lustricola TaxID=2025994 RepID=A0A2T3A177_9PEZI|nr:hypothetical protein BD289DRAFT_373295 [Coniella lustricola]